MPGSGRCKPTLRDLRHERSRFASARGAVSAATFPARGSGDARSQTDRRDHVQRLGFDWPARRRRLRGLDAQIPTRNGGKNPLVVLADADLLTKSWTIVKPGEPSTRFSIPQGISWSPHSTG